MSYNIFRDINKEKYSLRLVVIITVSLSFVFAIICLFVTMAYVRDKEKKIYVLDNGNAFRLAKIQNVKDNRLYEVRDFTRQILNLSFNFSSDVAFNTENLGMANTYFADQSYRRYIETLQNSQFFQDMAAKNLTQSIINIPGKGSFNINIQGAQSPYTVAIEFYVAIGSVYKKMIAQFVLEDVFRTDLNSHGFAAKSFVFEAQEIDKLP
jgi:hypothetical protein